MDALSRSNRERGECVVNLRMCVRERAVIARAQVPVWAYNGVTS